MSLRTEVETRRLAYYERTLNRIASQVAGNTQFQAERITGIMDEIDELRELFNSLSSRVERMAEFLNQQVKKTEASFAAKASKAKAQTEAKAPNDVVG